MMTMECIEMEERIREISVISCQQMFTQTLFNEWW